jgi:hypothetical protein
MYQRRYDQGTPHPGGDLLGEVTVTDYYRDDVIIVELDGREYRYQTPHTYHIGDILRVQGWVDTDHP